MTPIQDHGHDYTEPNSGQGHGHAAASSGNAVSNQSQDVSIGGNATSFATTGITINGVNGTGVTQAQRNPPVNIALLPIIKI